jgi:hypothetical protein
METVRRFRKPASGTYSSLDYRPFVQSSETSRNSSGIFGSAEMYRLDGSVVYSWDLDGNGLKEYTITK